MDFSRPLKEALYFFRQFKKEKYKLPVGRASPLAGQ
jgi:hypothetical protein